MFYDLLGAFIVGGTLGLMAWLLFRARRRRVPRFLLPLVIGGSMLGYTIWNEYTWASRTIEALPAGLEVIEKIPQSVVWQPWTYLFPRVSRMIVLNRAQVRRNARFPGYVFIELALLERLLPARRAAMIVDCNTARRADVSEEAHLFEGGLPPDDAWVSLRRDSPLFHAACGSAAE